MFSILGLVGDSVRIIGLVSVRRGGMANKFVIVKGI